MIIKPQMKRGISAFWALAIGVMLISGSVIAETPLRIGVYGERLAQGMTEALRAAADMECETIESLDAETIFQYDVVVLTAGRGIADHDWLDALEIHVRCGGGLILHHTSAGYQGWSRVLFPDLFIAEGKSRQRDMSVADKQHSLALDVAAGFSQDYQDHITLAPGEKGVVIVRNKDDEVVVVAGEVEAGRIVGNGMLPGVAMIKGKNIESLPGKAELQLLLNAARWAGEGRLTALDAAELADRRRRVELAVELRNEALVAESYNPMGGGAAGGYDRDWFADSMYNDMGFVHPPIEILPGRFFMFDGVNTAIAARNTQLRPYGETLSILRQLKWLGVTDIITHSGGPQSNLRYLSTMTNAVLSARAKRYGGDYLEILVKASHETGLNVWGFWHSRQDRGSFPISDAHGKPYAEYGDIKNPAYIEQAKYCIDELVERYNPYGNFKGIFLDELWHPFSADYMEGQTDAFVEFCRERFGETPPAELDLSARFAQGPEWYDPADVWWRRYVLFRNHFTVEYIREVTAYANSKGLQTMPQIGFNTRWFSGHGDVPRLLAAGNLTWTYENRNNSRYEQYPADSIILATHSRTHSGIQQIAHLRGKYGSQFALEQTWPPIAGGKNPRTIEVLKRQVRACREWFGAESVSPYALVVNRVTMDLSVPNAIQEYRLAANDVQAWLQQRYPVAQLMVQDYKYFERYRTLIGTRFGLRYMAGEAYNELRRYIEEGGVLIALDDRISTSREDLTGETDFYEELTGVRRVESDAAADENPYQGEIVWNEQVIDKPASAGTGLIRRSVNVPAADVAVLARCIDGTPLITSRQLGRGQVAAFHGDLTKWLEQPETRQYALDCVGTLLEYLAPSPIRLEGNAQIYNAVRKGNWVAVSLVGIGTDFGTLSTDFPARGRLWVDVKALGLDFPRYKVVSLARDREKMTQGEHWDEFSQNYWTAEILTDDGIEIFIPRDSLADLDLRPGFKTPRVQRSVALWNQSRQARSYEHEIIAIAPVDEPAMVPLSD